jgi:hypothetical protein
MKAKRAALGKLRAPRRRRPHHPDHHLALLADQPVCYSDIGPDFYASKVSSRMTRSHVHPLEFRKNATCWASG